MDLAVIAVEEEEEEAVSAVVAVVSCLMYIHVALGTHLDICIRLSRWIWWRSWSRRLLIRLFFLITHSKTHPSHKNMFLGSLTFMQFVYE